MNRKIKYNDVLTEEDFYPPVDDRYLKSNVYDINIYSGDNFADYCEDFYEMLDEEDYWQD